MLQLNLTGTLPVEFASLRHLQEIDLSQNYINGSIPAEFGQLPLITLSLVGNRLGGTIPGQIGNITTLVELVLQDNQFEGTLPMELGNLRSLKKLILSGNNFNGTIPVTFGKLTNLIDFNIDGTRISGHIPEFIGNWTRLETLTIQGTSMEGPIPYAISQLTSLRTLRLANLVGPNMSFPSLQNMTNMGYLVLRNCSIIGQIPSYLASLSLLILDLSFNMLHGQIPSPPGSLIAIEYLFLSHNSLTGETPGWIINDKYDHVDLLYNNFTRTRKATCTIPNINLVSSHSSSTETLVPWCMQPNLPCPRNSNGHSFFINCGGRLTNYEGNEYEENASDEGPSHFESFNDRWAYSSTGVFTGNDRATSYIATNATSMISTGEVYQTARLSPSSLKFYGLCLRRGSYRVRLHFAEIMFTRGPNFGSLGRRLFDVSIQGEVVLRDFDIAHEAKGVGIGIFRDFDVFVNDTTLEIHLYWTGKGTTSIPYRGVYGPLISAIAVTPNFDVGKGLSVGAIIGIAVSSCGVLLLILVVLWYLICNNGEGTPSEAGILMTEHDSFSDGGNITIPIQVLREATNNFREDNIIGRGGFGVVYKGELLDGTQIAVKRMESSAVNDKGLNEFKAEIEVLTKVKHRNLVALHGFCNNGNERLLVYEYMSQGCLEDHLFRWKNKGLDSLAWNRRLAIALDVARGVEYLHSLANQSFIHRDLKPSNVLLGDDFRAKVSDFGLVKSVPAGGSSVHTRFAGTFGYLAPELAATGRVTTKVDIYSFGVILMELMTGRRALDNSLPEEQINIVTYFRQLVIRKESIQDFVDPTLPPSMDENTLESIFKVAELAVNCTAREAHQRPDMSYVVSVLSPLVEQWTSVPDEGESSGTGDKNSLLQALEKWKANEDSFFETE